MDINTMQSQSVNDSEKSASKIDHTQSINSDKVKSKKDSRKVTAKERQEARLRLAQQKLNEFQKKNRQAKSDLIELKAELKRTRIEEAKKAKDTLIYRLGDIALDFINSNQPITNQTLLDRLDPKVLARYKTAQKDLQIENPA
jgi:molecular chaperone GrpE (heat shock protein)